MRARHNPPPRSSTWRIEMNKLGASDELAATGSPVREGLAEPQETYHNDGGKSATPDGPKFSAANGLRIWSGPKTSKPAKTKPTWRSLQPDTFNSVKGL